MPLLMGDDDDMQTSTIGSGFSFTGKRIDGLEATEYTLVTIAEDETGSVSGFEKLLDQCVASCVDGCKLSPRSDNIMVRVVRFGTQYPKGVEEVHGFIPVNDIDTSKYTPSRPGGLTTLNDAVCNSVGATNKYGEDLRAQDYNCNGIIFVITDGGENASTTSMSQVQRELQATVREEKLESMISILIGINAAQVKDVLENYQRETGIDKYIDAGDLTKQSAAKLANFVSQSVSSQSQALGTGGPSQNVAATI